MDFHFAAFIASLVLCTLGFASLCAGEFHHAFWAVMIAAMIAQMPEIDGREGDAEGKDSLTLPWVERRDHAE